MSEAWAKLREWAVLASKGWLLLSGSVVLSSLKAAVYTPKYHKHRSLCLCTMCMRGAWTRTSGRRRGRKSKRCRHSGCGWEPGSEIDQCVNDVQEIRSSRRCGMRILQRLANHTKWCMNPKSAALIAQIVNPGCIHANMILSKYSWGMPVTKYR